MIPVFPIDEDRIEIVKGRMVCVVTTKGERFIGRASGCRNGKFVLEFEDDSLDPDCDEPEKHHHEHHDHEHKHEEHQHEKKKHPKPQKRKKTIKKRHHHHKNCGCKICKNTKTSAFFPNRIRRRREIEFDLAAIAFLFLLVL
jgi:hypothetical protein